jgi:hypothetical protein
MRRARTSTLFSLSFTVHPRPRRESPFDFDCDNHIGVSELVALDVSYVFLSGLKRFPFESWASIQRLCANSPATWVPKSAIIFSSCLHPLPVPRPHFIGEVVKLAQSE